MGGTTYRIEYDLEPAHSARTTCATFLIDGTTIMAPAASLQEERWHR